MSDPLSADNVNPAYLLPGTTIHAYTVKKLLGRGGMGATYLVEREGRPFALKIATYSLGDTEEERQEEVARVKREVASLNGVDAHPNIVTIHGHDVWPSIDQGWVYIVMEFVDGLHLNIWRQRTKPSLRVILEVFAQIADALAEIHRLKVTHRDLKCDNIMVRVADNKAFVIDFGIAKPASARTVTRYNSTAGTVPHFPPELIKHLQNLHLQSPGAAGKQFPWNAKADLWGMGLMLYECVTGRPAFPYLSDDDEHQMLDNILKLQPQAPSLITPALPVSIDQLVFSLLEKDPERRTDSAMQLRDTIDELLGAADASWDVPLEVPARPARERAPSPGARRTTASRPAAVNASPSGVTSSILTSPSVSASAVQQQAPAATRPATAAEVKAFAPPTGVRAPTGFDPPVAAAAAPQPREQAPQFNTGVRNAMAQVSQASGAEASGNRTSRILVAAGGTLVLGLLGFFFVVANTGQPDAPTEKPRSLLQAVEQGGESKAAIDGPVLPTPVPSPSTGSGPLGETGAAASASPAPHEVTAPAAASPASSSGGSLAAAPKGGEAEAVDATIRREYGGRPAVSPSGEQTVVPASGSSGAGRQVRPATATRSSSWLQRVGPSEGQRVASATPSVDEALGQQPKVGVPLGDRVMCRLLTNLDSRTCSDGPVECQLVRPHAVRGEVKLPSRTMAYGTCQAGSNGRFTIQFTRLRLPDNTTLVFSGLAQDLEERKPGLLASRRIAGEPVKQSVAGDVLKGAAGTVLSTVTGGTTQEIARGAGQTVLSASGPSQSTTSGDALLLDAGVDFAIFVSSGF